MSHQLETLPLFKCSAFRQSYVRTKHKGGSFVFFSDAVLFSIAKIRVHLVNLGATLKQFGRVNTI